MQHTVDISIDRGNLLFVSKTGNCTGGIATDAFQFQQFLNRVGDASSILGDYLARNSLESNRSHIIA